MFGVDSPRLLGSRPAVLAATLPSNKFYLLYSALCLEILFQPALGPQQLAIWLCKDSVIRHYSC